MLFSRTMRSKLPSRTAKSCMLTTTRLPQECVHVCGWQWPCFWRTRRPLRLLHFWRTLSHMRVHVIQIIIIIQHRELLALGCSNLVRCRLIIIICGCRRLHIHSFAWCFEAARTARNTIGALDDEAFALWCATRDMARGRCKSTIYVKQPVDKVELAPKWCGTRWWVPQLRCDAKRSESVE